MIIEKIKQNKRHGILAILLTTAIFLTWSFLSHSPSGYYSKIFSIGSSVCHQIPSHSFNVGPAQFPVCARCTGLYMGSFIGIVYAFLSGKKIGVPKIKFIVFLAFLFLLWAGDGLNSLISDFLNKPFLYQTSNLSRLVTGYGMGLVMSTALVTLFNLTVWKTGINTPVLENVYQIIGYGKRTSGFPAYRFCYYSYCAIYHLPVILNFLDYFFKEGKSIHQLERYNCLHDCWLFHCNRTNSFDDRSAEQNTLLINNNFKWKNNGISIRYIFSVWAFCQCGFKCIYPLVGHCSDGSFHRSNHT